MAYEEIREIPGFKGYFVSPNGDVYSNKSGKMKKSQIASVSWTPAR